jgi:hypothetical protein
MRFGKTSIAVTVAFGFGLAAALTYHYWPASDGGAKVLQPTTLTPSVINVVPKEPMPQAVSAPIPKVIAQPASAPVRLTPDQEFKRLAAPGATFSEHQEAYRMATDCMKESAPGGVRIEPPAIINGKVIAGPCNLAPGTWQDLETRKRLMTECAEAGLCAAQLFAESPSGNNPGAFTQAEFDELQAKAHKKGLEVGDPFALSAEARLLLEASKKQPTAEARATLIKALSYDIASAASMSYISGMQYITGKPFNAKEDPSLNRKLPMYETAGLTQADVKIATQEARQLVDKFKKAKEAP